MNVAVFACHHVGQLAAVHRHTQALAHTAQQLGTALLVAQLARQDVGGRVALTQVVAEAGKAHRQTGLQLRAHVEHHHQVHAGVDLGVVIGALRHAPEPVDFRQQSRQRAAVAQHGKHARGLVGHQPARQLLPDALGHQVVDLATGDHLKHQRHCLGRDGEIGKTRRKARDAQNAHRVFAKRRTDMTKQFGLQVVHTTVWVNQMLGIKLTVNQDR